MIYYKKGYKYQLTRQYHIKLSFAPRYPFTTKWFSLGVDGVLAIHAGYAWDGATGARDAPEIMRASLVHDVLYQAMRLGLLDQAYRMKADEELRKICLEAGMNPVKADIVFLAVQGFGGAHAIKGTEQQEETAP